MLRLELGFRHCPCPYWMLIVNSIRQAVIISTHQPRLNGPNRIHINIGLAQWIWCGRRLRSLVFQIMVDNSVEVLREHIVVICCIFTRQANTKSSVYPKPVSSTGSISAASKFAATNFAAALHCLRVLVVRKTWSSSLSVSEPPESGFAPRVCRFPRSSSAS